MNNTHDPLRAIAEAKRFDCDVFDDDTAFADWAQSLARAYLNEKPHEPCSASSPSTSEIGMGSVSPGAGHPASPPHAAAVGDDVERRRIVCAAVRHVNALTFSLPRPARHHDILQAMHALGLSTKHGDNDQGFLDSHGVFVRRSRARVIAYEAGQLLSNARMTDELFSEDVW